MLWFDLLVVTEPLTPRQVGSSVLLIAGLRSQVLRETREKISTSLCCSSGIITKGCHGFFSLSTSTLFPNNIPLTTFLPTLGLIEYVLNSNFGVSVVQTGFLGGFKEL